MPESIRHFQRTACAEAGENEDLQVSSTDHHSLPILVLQSHYQTHILSLPRPSPTFPSHLIPKKLLIEVNSMTSFQLVPVCPVEDYEAMYLTTTFGVHRRVGGQGFRKVRETITFLSRVNTTLAPLVLDEQRVRRISAYLETDDIGC